ncbi:MAG: hypothetical protein ABI851_05330 [Saprospiraceae bacterium]
MSKDKGVKNSKKSPESKTSGKIKAVSDYKSEGKSKDAVIDIFSNKSDSKSDKSKKH